MTAVPPTTLLEREGPLRTLRAALGEMLAGAGRLVLVGGEAGVGKTALVRTLCAQARATARILEGACDPLTTPRPLGPFADVAAAVGGELARRVDDDEGAPSVLAVLVEELRRRPTVLVLEDLHWADEATLDLLRLLSRRVDGTRSLVIGTFRDDELDARHPLRLVLGGLATLPAVQRLQLAPLSLSAVRVLAVLRDVNADELHRRTGGNPFFVTEVLAGDGDDVPETVRDAVLSRVARLPADAQRLLEVVAVVPGEVELWLLERVASNDLSALTSCLGSGVLVERGPNVAFRHELARVTVESAVDALRRRSLHRALLAALSEPPAGSTDPARLAHHAEAAGDAGAVVLHAVAAGQQAAARSAHREAAEQLGRALRFSSGLGNEEVAALHDQRMDECQLSERVEEALQSGAAALERYQALGDRLREGDVLRRLARLRYLAGQANDARATASAAVELLEKLPAGRELAMAYGAVAQFAQIDLELETAIRWAEKAQALGEQLGEPEIVAYALATAGVAESVAGGSPERLHRSLAISLEHGLEEHVGRAYGALTFAAARRRAWADLDRWLDDGLRHASEHNLEGARLYLLGWRAAGSIARGRWDDAAADATTALSHPDARLARVWALLALAHLRARRGDPDVWPPLDEAWELTEGETAQKRVPMSLVALEAAFLEGDLERAALMADSLPVTQLVDRWIAGALAVWRRRLGFPPEDTGSLPEPYALELAGQHEAAAERWVALECPYDAGLALAWSNHEASLRHAHEVFVGIGARPMAGIVARRLRERGATGLPRGPRRTTRRNPGGLTERETDVIRLLANGLRNREIAERLFVSRRTVDHHVSAILRKLAVSSRGEAVAAARRLRLLEDR